jgi:hypothetical protein
MAIWFILLLCIIIHNGIESIKVVHYFLKAQVVPRSKYLPSRL